MDSTVRVVTSFSKYTDSALATKARLILDSMKDNSYLPNPIPDLGEIQNVLVAFETALTKAEEGGSLEIEKKETQRAKLAKLLKKLALYVQLEGDGNEEALKSSGFSLSKPREKHGVLPKPEEFSLHPETKGKIKLKLKAIRGAHSYRYEYRKVNTENWQVLVGTKSHLSITELESGQEYEFRVAGVGTEKERVYSDVLRSFIL